MSSPSLSNYLRTERKRLGFSQEEVAFLLGIRSSAVSRFESVVRLPSLETALAFEALFQKPASELFRGLSQEVSTQVTARAKALGYQTKFQKSDRLTQKKLKNLKALAQPQAELTA